MNGAASYWRTRGMFRCTSRQRARYFTYIIKSRIWHIQNAQMRKLLICDSSFEKTPCVQTKILVGEDELLKLCSIGIKF